MVPATPVPATHKSRGKATASTRPLTDLIPSPQDYVPRLPPSSETLAKMRLGKFLWREERGREKDGLPVSGYFVCRADSDSEDEGDRKEDQEDLIEWEVALGIGQHAGEEAIDWILDVCLFP